MNPLYTNQNAIRSRSSLIALFSFMCLFSFEGFRAGLLTHLNGETPALFGLIPTSPISLDIALKYIVPCALILLVVFSYMLLQVIWTGVLLKLYIEENVVLAFYNGFSKKKVSYSIKNIKKISYKSEHSSIGASATVTASGTSIITERLYIHYQKQNLKIKKINLVSGEKKVIRKVGKSLKTLMSSA